MMSAKVRMNARGWSTQTMVATELGISPSNLAKLIDRGQLPLPTRKLDGGRRRYYSADEVDTLKECWHKLQH